MRNKYPPFDENKSDRLSKTGSKYDPTLRVHRPIIPHRTFNLGLKRITPGLQIIKLTNRNLMYMNPLWRDVRRIQRSTEDNVH